MSRDIAPFGVRMPSELKRALTGAAKVNKRSLNAEIVDRLEETVRQDDWLPPGLAFDDMIGEIEEVMAERDEVQERYDREYALDAFDAMKDEILDAIREKPPK